MRTMTNAITEMLKPCFLWAKNNESKFLIFLSFLNQLGGLSTPPNSGSILIGAGSKDAQQLASSEQDIF